MKTVIFIQLVCLMISSFFPLNAADNKKNSSKKNLLIEKFTEDTTDTKEESIPLDTIVKLGGRRLLVQVKSVSRTNIYYTDPGNDKSKEIRRKDVQKILYENGRVEVYNKPIMMMIDETQWEAVYLTRDKSEIEGLYERGKIDSESSTSVRSKKAAKRSATIRLQKKAAAKGADVIYVIHEEAKGGFGDIPGYEMEGIAYSFEPPKPGEPGAEEE